MHIPDGFIPLLQTIIYWIIALVFIALALRWARKELSEEKVPIVAVLAAAIFAIQAFNLPVGMGTSGHLVGGALAAIILGSPYAAVFILSIVLIIQGVIFGDGGITTMGANIVNMGVKSAIKNPYVSAGIAAWFACVIPALAASVELWIAGTFPLVGGMIAMGTYHAAIGVIEAVITAVAVYLIWHARPELDWSTMSQADLGGVTAA